MNFNGLVSTCFAKGGPLEVMYKPIRETSAYNLWQIIERHSSEKPITFVEQQNFWTKFKKLWNMVYRAVKRTTGIALWKCDIATIPVHQIIGILESMRVESAEAKAIVEIVLDRPKFNVDI
ncbi:unnamed protein product [Didymodactylos carnosus]|uniref:Uncharacterized protein n=2 Tax=Didymodactylos carnosus TaxID=1234261 RepID=A0A815Q5B3_9BILA|nr:unnamed protein product [Didymodactylos carnosus]CAF4329359.1 unnamed protein product [Didymodactylos carnosus]